MTLSAELRAAIRAYDGRATTILSEAATRFGSRRGYIGALVALAADEDAHVSEVATWMLKAALEDGRCLTSDQIGTLVDSRDAITAWQAQLHICQAASLMDVSQDHAEHFRRWLEPLLSADRPFLRAWAMDALCHLNPIACEALLNRMEDDKAASVRARIRNLRNTTARRPGARGG